MPKVDGNPPKLKPYLSLGLDINWADGDKDGHCTCPFCGKAGKLSITIEDGEWNCPSCGQESTREDGERKSGGRIYNFIREFWDHCYKSTSVEAYKELQEWRDLYNIDTPAQWGACKSTVTGEWLIPGFRPNGKLCSLYRRSRLYDKDKQRWYYRLLVMAEVGHQLHGINLYDPDAEYVYLCEGPWDGMALWEALGMSRWDGQQVVGTGNTASSFRSDASVLATPGANVFRDEWAELFAGKVAVLLYDNDHPREHPTTGKLLDPVGYKAVQRVTDALSKSPTPPIEIQYLRWGPDGYDPELKSGADVGDLICGKL